jgi:hypothetical protein
MDDRRGGAAFRPTVPSNRAPSGHNAGSGRPCSAEPPLLPKSTYVARLVLAGRCPDGDVWVQLLRPEVRVAGGRGQVSLTGMTTLVISNGSALRMNSGCVA